MTAIPTLGSLRKVPQSTSRELISGSLSEPLSQLTKSLMVPSFNPHVYTRITFRAKEEGSISLAIEAIPDELLYKIFSYLTQGELVEAACVNKRFQSIAGDWRLWQESELKYRCPLLESIFNKKAWVKHVNLRGFGIAKPVTPEAAALAAKAALQDLHRLERIFQNALHKYLIISDWEFYR